MGHSAEIVEYAFHVLLVDSLGLKNGKMKQKFSYCYPTVACYLGDELLYDEQQVCSDL